MSTTNTENKKPPNRLPETPAETNSKDPSKKG